MAMNDTKPILPICFCVHRNVAMAKRDLIDGKVTRRLELVTNGIRSFLEKGFNVNSGYTPDAAILLFSGSANWLSEFGTILDAQDVEMIQGESETRCCLGNAMSAALKAIEKRVESHRRNGKHYLKPILVVVSAGEENYGQQNVWDEASRQCQRKIQKKELTALMCAVTRIGNENLLKAAAPGGIVIRVEDEDIFGTLSNVGQYVESERSTPAEPAGSAEGYILGIFTDITEQKGR